MQKNVTLLAGINDETPSETVYNLPNPVAIVQFDYEPGSTISIPVPGQNQIVYPDLTSLNQQALTATNNNKTPESTSSLPDSFLDIVFVANNYTNFDQFHTDAKSMSHFLTTIYPFNLFTQSLRFHYIDNQQYLGCFRPDSIPRLIICDHYLVQLAAASVPSDQLIVIDNSNEYGGSGIYGLAVVYRDISALAKEVMVHEFGHSFGSLADEYYLGPVYSSPPPWPIVRPMLNAKAGIKFPEHPVFLNVVIVIFFVPR
jgi:hypothetical protein